MGTPLWICPDCHGPAVWTLFAGEPYYYCEGECDGFRQLELFETDGVRGTMKGDGPDGLAAPPFKNINERNALPF